MAYLWRCCLLLVIVIVVIRADDDDDDRWIVTVTETQLGSSVLLSCDFGTFPNASRPHQWMVPGLTILDAGYDDGRWTVADNASLLSVHNVSTADFGLYFCMMLTEDTDGQTKIYMNRIGLNLRGPYFETIFDKYETNTILGFSCMLGFLVLAGMGAWAWSNRWELKAGADDDTPPGWEQEEEKKEGKESFNYVNAGYKMREDEGKANSHYVNGGYEMEKVEPENEYESFKF